MESTPPRYHLSSKFFENVYRFFNPMKMRQMRWQLEKAAAHFTGVEWRFGINPMAVGWNLSYILAPRVFDCVSR